MTKSVFTPVRAFGALGASAAGIAAAALFAAQPALAENQDDDAKVAMTEGEQELAKLLEGRVAGEPQSCIRSRLNDRMTVIDETAYVYGRGKTIYVQRTRDPEDIDSRDALVSRRFSGSQVCKLDVVTTIDPFNGFLTGVVFFDDFVPYTRVESDEG
ncbi:MAG: hypothetical protein ACX930_14575 [Erythrobacter sp.]